MLKVAWLAKRLEVKEGCDRKLEEILREEDCSEEEKERRKVVEECEIGRRLVEVAEKSKVGEEEASMAIGS